MVQIELHRFPGPPAYLGCPKHFKRLYIVSAVGITDISLKIQKHFSGKTKVCMKRERKKNFFG